MGAARCKSWPTGSEGKAPQKPMAGRASHPAGHCCHWSLHLEGQTGRHSHSLPRRSGFSARTPEANLTQTQHSALAHPAARPIHTQKPNILAKRALCLRPHLWGDGTALRPPRQTDRRPARRLGRPGQACTRPRRTSPCKSFFRRGAGSRICRGAPPHRNGAASCQTLAHRHSLPRQPRPNLALNTLIRSSVVAAGEVVQNFYRFF